MEKYQSSPLVFFPFPDRAGNIPSDDSASAIITHNLAAISERLERLVEVLDRRLTGIQNELSRRQ